MATLYVIGTPIGNLGDITLRALRVLEEVSLILCEDTRVTLKLLNKYKINGVTQRLDAHTEGKMATDVINLFEEWKTIALVTDAGTPGISDPGYRLVAAARKEKFQVIGIPGPSAVITALSISGLPADNFTFLGFLPHKKGRETLFKEIAESSRVIVFYESTHRILKTLESLSKYLEEDRTIVIARELTKIHEEVFSGTATDALKYFLETPVKQKGEFVVIISGRK